MTEEIKKREYKKGLIVTFLMISMIQMPNFALFPAVEYIATEVFPERSLQTIQNVTALPNLIAIFSGIISTLLLRRGITTKRFTAILGISFYSFTGIMAFFLNTQFWHLIFLNVLIGAGMSTCIPGLHSILFDNFDEKMRRILSGLQATFKNVGVVIMSIVGGMLIPIVWYGCHLTTLFAIPVLVLAIIFVPRDKKLKPSADIVRTKLPGRVFFYTGMFLVFMIVYQAAPMNFSTHLARGDIGNAAVAGAGTAMMMASGAVGGIVFAKLWPFLRENLFAVTFVILFVGFSIFNLFSRSLVMSITAMLLCGFAGGLFIPGVIFSVSKLTDPTNSATAALFMGCIAPAGGGFLSPHIMTRLTYALAGESTRFRYQFVGMVCLALALAVFMHFRSREKNSCQ